MAILLNQVTIIYERWTFRRAIKILKMAEKTMHIYYVLCQSILIAIINRSRVCRWSGTPVVVNAFYQRLKNSISKSVILYLTLLGNYSDLAWWIPVIAESNMHCT